MNYGSMTGSMALKRAICDLLKRTFVNSPSVRLDPDRMAVLSGCTACIDALVFLLMDENAGVLLPTPTYTAFYNDTQARARLQIAEFDDFDEDRDIEEQLNEALEAARGRGIVVRALLLTNPSNPLGTVYRDHTIKSSLLWCMSKSIHFIADEIYGLSVHDPGTNFRSSMNTLYELVDTGVVSADAAQSHFHLLYGLSKDWCASGLRIGCLYSDNVPLQEALTSLAPMASCSNHQQHQIACTLADVAFTDSFIAYNRSALRESYVTLTTGLRALRIPFRDAAAGLFVFVDMREWLDEQSAAGEERLWNKLLDLKVIFTPGLACKAKQPGWFRVCFAWVSDAAIVELLRRLGKFLSDSG